MLEHIKDLEIQVTKYESLNCEFIGGEDAFIEIEVCDRAIVDNYENTILSRSDAQQLYDWLGEALKQEVSA